VLLPFFSTAWASTLQAAFLPHKRRQPSCPRKNGFKERVFAESYLQIDGKWADHVLFALTRERLGCAAAAPRR